MKVGEASNQFPEFPQQKKVKGKDSAAAAGRGGVAAKKDAEFSEAFFNAAEGNIRASLDELLKGLQAQGERLARSQNFEELDKYKELVRSFLAKLTQDLYKLRPANTGRPGNKVYVILEKVDAELDRLAQMVLAGQVPQLRILEKLDQIKGLLLDAYK